MKKIVSGILFVLVVFPAAVNAKVLANVGGLEITDRDVAARMAQIPPEYKRAFATEDGQKRLIEQLTQEKLIYLKAKKENYETNADVLKQLERIKPDIMIRQFLADILAEIKPDEKELKAYYLENTSEYAEEEQVWAKHILCKTEAEAQAARKRVQEGESFEDVAKDVSTGPSGKNGGDLGWFAKDRMVTEFAEAAFGLEKDGLSEPVKTQFGYHIIKSYGKKAGTTKPFDAVRDDVAQKLTAQKHQEYVEEMIKDLKKVHSVTIY